MYTKLTRLREMVVASNHVADVELTVRRRQG